MIGLIFSFLCAFIYFIRFSLINYIFSEIAKVAFLLEEDNANREVRTAVIRLVFCEYLLLFR